MRTRAMALPVIDSVRPSSPLAPAASPTTGLLAVEGARLDAETRGAFERFFAHDFSRVRIHADADAAAAARAIDARAFTVGNDVVFGRGMYRPETLGGQRLLAHELAHVAQQRGGADAARQAGTPEDHHEREAERAAATFSRGAWRGRYGEVAAGVTQHAEARPVSAMPELTRSGTRIQRVQLTYDDGPDSGGNTRTVLSALNAAGARATFYLVGRRVAQGDNWRVVFDIAAGGHWLGNHAYDWNDATDNHIFLHGTAEERAGRMLNTEWAIRDALLRGRSDAQQRNAWMTIPQASRAYVDDVIARGTGRFRTPGFRSHWWSADGLTTGAAIRSANQVLAAAGLRPFATTDVTSWGITREGVTVDPDDWRAGRTRAQVESNVTGSVSSNADSVLLHSRIAASAAATPAIVAGIKRRGWTFDPTAQGGIGGMPSAGFAGLSTISDPPTSAQIASARAFLRSQVPSIGGYLAGSLAIGIFQMTQRAGQAEVAAFIAEIRGTTVQTPNGPIPLANWMNDNPEWRLLAGFYENWLTQRPFPRISGVTI